MGRGGERGGEGRYKGGGEGGWGFQNQGPWGDKLRESSRKPGTFVVCMCVFVTCEWEKGSKKTKKKKKRKKKREGRGKYVLRPLTYIIIF